MFHVKHTARPVKHFFGSTRESDSSKSTRFQQLGMSEASALEEDVASLFNHPVALRTTPPHLRRGAVLNDSLVIHAGSRFLYLGSSTDLNRTSRLIRILLRGRKLPLIQDVRRRGRLGGRQDLFRTNRSKRRTTPRGGSRPDSGGVARLATGWLAATAGSSPPVC
jgi:hypothetical protein